MKKRILMLLVGAMMMFYMTACGSSSSDTTTDTSSTDTSEDTSTTDTTEDTSSDDTSSDNTADDSSSTEGAYEDGYYFATGDEFDNGYEDAVILKVENGLITEATWTAINQSGGADKKTLAENGEYDLGSETGSWAEQSERATDYLIETQDPTAIEYTDDEGHTDAISGVSIHVSGFFEVAQKALAAGPQEMGPYTDGTYHAEADEFDEGWKTTVDIEVLFGNIVAADWNAINEDDPTIDKKTYSASGEYGLDGDNGRWDEQAAKAEAYLLETQDPTAIEYTDDEGHVDAISGVSIHVKEFFDLAAEALADAQ